ncbi:MAG: YbhB/YbcL family Raf kinase inhibitor-like protein [Anaerolineales bacterium]
MSTKFQKRLWLCAGMLLLLLTACTPSQATATIEPTQAEIATVTMAEHAATTGQTIAPFELSGIAFEAEAVIPDRYSCKGEDISPELYWGDPPAGTQSFALLFNDPEARSSGWMHWVVYNIPAEARGLSEAIQPGAIIEGTMVHGSSDWGTLEYGGPCPPQGVTHRYVFTLYALDTLLDLDPGSSKTELIAAMDEHILAQIELAANFTR